MPFKKLTTKEIERLQQIRRQAEEDHEFLETLAAKKRDAYDEMSDKWKEGERGEAADATTSALESGRDALETLKDGFDDIEGMNDE